MPRFTVRLRGRGAVELPAYGVADAEHQVEKEIRRAWPDARVDVVEIGRATSGRIVEDFRITYLLRAELLVEAEAAEKAAGAAYRRARELLSGTRYVGTAWERGEVVSPPGS